MVEFKEKPLKETIAYKALQSMYKELTKNMIPSDPLKVLEMEKKLAQEAELNFGVYKAKEHIKQMLKQNKLNYKEVKRIRRLKIKLAVKTLVKILLHC